MLCTIGLDEDSERVLGYAHQAAAEAHSNLHIIHAIQFIIPICPSSWTSTNKFSRRKGSKRVSALPICNEESGPRRRFGLLSVPSRRRCLRLLGSSTLTR